MARITEKEAQALTGWRKRPGKNKYRAKPRTVDGIRFASKKEAKRYSLLRQQEKAGEISKLECHPTFSIEVNGDPICTYSADFQYVNNDGDTIVEDVKSPITSTYLFRIKKKLMRAVHGIEVHEVY